MLFMSQPRRIKKKKVYIIEYIETTNFNILIFFLTTIRKQWILLQKLIIK